MGLFHQQTRSVFQLLCVPLGCGSLQKTAFLIIATVPYGPGIQAPLAIGSRQSRGVPCVDCACLLALLRQWESTWGGGMPAALARQVKNAGRQSILLPHLHFSKAVGDCCDCAHLLLPVRWRESVKLVPDSTSVPGEGLYWSLSLWQML